MDDVKERLVGVAQSLIQKQGYNGFSYRDIAVEVGIRSASIHYHFPTKADLGAAVAARYTDRFMEMLAAAEEETTDVFRVLSFYASLFKETLANDGRMCLCGILGAEAASLPTSVTAEVKRFFAVNLEWLTRLFSRGSEIGGVESADRPATEAALFLATLEGAMVLAKGIDDPKVFDEILEAALGRHR